MCGCAPNHALVGLDVQDNGTNYYYKLTWDVPSYDQEQRRCHFAR